VAEVRVRALYAEAIFTSSQSVQASKQSFEAVIDNSLTNTQALTKVCALYGELVIALDFPQLVRVSKQSFEAILDNSNTNTAAAVKVPFLSAELLLGVAAQAGVSKQSFEAIMDNSETNPVADIKVAALYGEILAQRGPAAPIPLDDPSGFDFFVHNWSNVVTMTTSYMTDVVQAQDTLAEERRALWSRPNRQIRFTWLQNDPEWMIHLRAATTRFPNERLVAPLYQHQMFPTSSSGASATINLDSTKRPLFVGQRIVILKLNRDRSRVDAADMRRVTYKADTYIELDSPTSFAIGETDTVIFPTMDTEVNLKSAISFVSETVGRVDMDLTEVVGPSALPPLSIALPGDIESAYSIPIFDFEHDWSEPLQTHYIRDGRNFTQGRGTVIDPQGARHRLLTAYKIGPFEREEFMRFATFFDYCQGRLRPFWLIDQENNWELLAINGAGSFLDFDPVGDFDEFITANEYVGVILEDGTRIVRHADDVEDLGGVWRITLDDPVTFSVGDERLIARARVSRFNKDELVETWVTDGVATCVSEIIEVLEEKDVDLG
jgi:hypothetical protein